MSAVWLPSVAFLAEPSLAGRFYSEGRRISMGGWFMGREVGVARMTGRNDRGPWVGEDGGGVAPIEEKVEKDAKYGGGGT